MVINQPSGQIKLTNVAIVRLKKGGKRFEIACYKNKITEFRQGIENDLSEVLQIDGVFLNVSRGQTASSADLKKAFKDFKNQDEVVKEILIKGEYQEGDKERQYHLDNLRKEIITLVAERTLNPDTGHSHSHGMIDKAMSEARYSITTSKPAKAQALDVIRIIQDKKILSIQRRQMRIRVVLATKDEELVESFKKLLLPHLSKVESEQDSYDEWEIVARIDPSAFRAISDLVQAEVQGNGRVETLSLAAEDESKTES